MTNNYTNYPVQQNYSLPSQFSQMANSLSMVPPQQSIFPQPNGNVYVLNNTSEVGTIPTTAGLSVGICLNENTLIIKSIQNGAPAQISYKLVPTTESGAETPMQSDVDIQEILKSHKLKIENLERQMQRVNEKVGGKLEWQV